MALRPAKCYRKIEKPYTRISQRKPKESYVVGVPGAKITNFVAGNQKKEFDTVIQLVSESNMQVRHNALEAARVSMNKHLESTLTSDGYYMRIRPFPHHVLREHSLATGAGADRFSSGMRMAFGRPIGKAAQIRTGQVIVDVYTSRTKLKEVKEAFRRANSKLPTQTSIAITMLDKPAAAHDIKVR